MENKLQQLTETLYAEGLEKGKNEAERMVKEAHEQSDKILADAHAEAEAIVKQAQNRAADMAKNNQTEIEMAGRQALSRIKTELAEAVVMQATVAGVKQAAADPAFIRDMLLQVAKNWNGATSQASLEALLPESERARLESAMAASAAQLLAAGVEVGYSKDVKSGFKVGTKNGGYYIAFTDESFEALMQQYLREKVAKMLFEK